MIDAAVRYAHVALLVIQNYYKKTTLSARQKASQGRWN
jgi:hypothetical protein